jgi:hypothetical protein
MRPSLLLLILVTLTSGQTFTVKDRHQIPLVIISDVKLFQYSSKLNQDIPHFQGILKTVSSVTLNAAIVGTIHKKDGSVDTFPIAVRFDLPPGASDVDEFGLPNFSAMPCTVLYPCVFKADSPYEIAYSFPQPWFSEGDVQSVEFSFPDDWQSPEDKRLAKEVQAKKDAADAARRKRLAAEHKRKQAELDARIAKERADEEARTVEERRKIRAACSTIYQNTADTKLKDLTVKEDQQVRACQALGLYPPQ